MICISVIGFKLAVEKAAYSWCSKQLGEPDSRWPESKWGYNVGFFTFVDEKDSILFLLKFGGKIV